MELLLATTNVGKVIEMKESLEGMNISVTSLHDLGITDSPDEHGNTFAENALIKARYYGSSLNMPTVADDSGIFVEALHDELGVHTRRWGAGPHVSDAEWIACFLSRMKSEHNKTARFVCCLAYIDAKGKEYLFEGTCPGSITETLESTYLPGLPISACFRPHSSAVVYSSMSTEEKNAISHRGKALAAFRRHLVQADGSDANDRCTRLQP